MKTYIGTKTLKAKPMTRIDYNVFRGWTLPDNENGSDEGYLVEYTDGGAPNVAGHNGYVSWSPKDVFERSYNELPIPKPDVPYSVTAQEMYETYARQQEDMSDKLYPEWKSLSLESQNSWLMKARSSTAI